MSVSELRDEVLRTAAAVVEAGALSASGHGNVSLRVPGRDEILYTAAPSLRTLRAESIARIRFDGTVVEGTVAGLSVAAAAMHLAVYEVRAGTGCVVHTHSPFATAFAVAGKPIGCWAEPLSIFGLEDGVPVVPYARRGSPEAVDHIRKAITAESKALLLANHGVLAFHETAAQTVQIGILVEEAAQLGVYAAGLGGPVEISGTP